MYPCYAQKLVLFPYMLNFIKLRCNFDAKFESSRILFIFGSAVKQC